MGKPAVREMPDVKRFASRNMVIPPVQRDLEFKLAAWMKEVVDYIGQNASMEGVSPSTYLVAQADGLDLIMHAPTSMKLNGSGARMVHANFVWGSRPDGRWYIRHVKFATDMSRKELTEAEKSELKERLQDKAAAENARHFHAREYAFKAEEHVQTWVADIQRGDHRIAALIDQVFEWGKKEASMPTNPYTPEDIALGFVGGGIGRAKNEAERVIEAAKYAQELKVASEEAEKLKKLAELYEKAEQIKSLAERGEKLRELAAGEKKDPVYEKSRNDILIESVIDQGADLAGNFIPGAGGLVKLFAGMLWEIAASSLTAKVTRIRARVYACFVAGFITGLTLAGAGAKVANRKDREYFQKGYDRGSAMSSNVSFEYQIALLHFASENIMSGLWRGSSRAVHGLKAANWSFPDDYMAAWTPELLGRAFITKLSTGRYLYQD